MIWKIYVKSYIKNCFNHKNIWTVIFELFYTLFWLKDDASELHVDEMFTDIRKRQAGMKDIKDINERMHRVDDKLDKLLAYVSSDEEDGRDYEA